MRAKERNTRKNTSPILEPSFLNEDFYIEDYREGQLQQVIEAVSDATHFLVVDPSQFKIFSMIDGSKDDSMKMLVLDPDYASVHVHRYSCKQIRNLSLQILPWRFLSLQPECIR